MKSLTLVVVITLGLTAAKGVAQDMDPTLQGFWTLNVEKSDFAGRPKPKMGFVNWGEHGWTFGIVSADGRLYADAVSTDVGCTLIGVFPNYSCEVEAITPRHVRFTVKQGSTIRRIRDIELRRDGFIQTIHRVIPPGGAPYIEKTIWERQGGK
jgi:hypothetical protein